jgi:hypothetical protein
MTNRPSRSCLTRHWLDYLDTLRDSLLAASSQEALALRWEISIVENELVRRGLPPRALESPDRGPSPWQTTYSPRPWSSPRAQARFGEALVRTGQKHKDPNLLRLGWLHQNSGAQTTTRRAGRAWRGRDEIAGQLPRALMPGQRTLSSRSITSFARPTVAHSCLAEI